MNDITRAFVNCKQKSPLFTAVTKVRECFCGAPALQGHMCDTCADKKEAE